MHLGPTVPCVPQSAPNFLFVRLYVYFCVYLFVCLCFPGPPAPLTASFQMSCSYHLFGEPEAQCPPEFMVFMYVYKTAMSLCFSVHTDVYFLTTRGSTSPVKHIICCLFEVVLRMSNVRGNPFWLCIKIWQKFCHKLWLFPHQVDNKRLNFSSGGLESYMLLLPHD